MTETPIPLPPGWEAAVGWSGGEARWLLGFWTSLGDHPHLSDARTSMSGHSWGWLAWARHAAVAPHLAPFDIGSSEMEGPHALLCDLTERKVYAASREEAERVVREQWPEEDEAQLTPEQMDAVMEHVRRAMAARPMPTAEQPMRSMREHSRLVAEMVRWLDEWREEKR